MSPTVWGYNHLSNILARRLGGREFLSLVAFLHQQATHQYGFFVRRLQATSMCSGDGPCPAPWSWRTASGSPRNAPFISQVIQSARRKSVGFIRHSDLDQIGSLFVSTNPASRSTNLLSTFLRTDPSIGVTLLLPRFPGSQTRLSHTCLYQSQLEVEEVEISGTSISPSGRVLGRGHCRLSALTFLKR